MKQRSYCDPADSMEAPSCLPEELKDTLEDIIRDAVLPLHLAEPIVAKIVKSLLEHGYQSAGTTEAPVSVKADVIRGFIQLFPPSQWTIMNWWAIQFALHSQSCENISPSMVCSVAGATRQGLNQHVAKWRKRLGLGKNPDLKRESIRLAGRRLRERVKS